MLVLLAFSAARRMWCWGPISGQGWSDHPPAGFTTRIPTMHTTHVCVHVVLMVTLSVCSVENRRKVGLFVDHHHHMATETTGGDGPSWVNLIYLLWNERFGHDVLLPLDFGPPLSPRGKDICCWCSLALQNVGHQSNWFAGEFSGEKWRKHLQPKLGYGNRWQFELLTGSLQIELSTNDGEHQHCWLELSGFLRSLIWTNIMYNVYELTLHNPEYAPIVRI